MRRAPPWGCFWVVFGLFGVVQGCSEVFGGVSEGLGGVWMWAPLLGSRWPFVDRLLVVCWSNLATALAMALGRGRPRTTPPPTPPDKTFLRVGLIG